MVDYYEEEDDEAFVAMNFAMLCDGGFDFNNEEACAFAAETQVSARTGISTSLAPSTSMSGRQDWLDIGAEMQFVQRVQNVVVARKVALSHPSLLAATTRWEKAMAKLLSRESSTFLCRMTHPREQRMEKHTWW